MCSTTAFITWIISNSIDQLETKEEQRSLQIGKGISTIISQLLAPDYAAVPSPSRVEGSLIKWVVFSIKISNCLTSEINDCKTTARNCPRLFLYKIK